MSDVPDQHLLRAWAERADEAAFRSLAGRYAGFVHGAALRRVGDAGLAEEITQDVFAALALEARKLGAHPTLAGWLHRTAMLMALDRVRRRARHDRRVAQFHAMNDDTAARDPWREIAPHLDAALDCLRTSDREVLMLHFAERLTFPQIAVRLGTNADAARMRTKRALDTLARLLHKKGVIIPATVLAAGLGGTFAQAAPATLVLTPAALAGLGKISASTVIMHALQTTKTAKVIASSALTLALSVPLILQQNQISAAEARLATLRRNPETTAVAPVSQSSRATAGTGKVEDRSFDLRKLAEDALTDDYFATRRVRRAIGHLDNNNLTGLIETAMHSGLLPAAREEFLRKLLLELKARDVALFLEWTMKVVAGVVPAQSVRNDYAYELQMEAMTQFRNWVAAQPSQAAAWAEANQEEWKQFRGIPLSTLTMAGLLKVDPARAYAMIEKSSVAECMATLLYADRTLSAEQTADLAKWAASSVTGDEKRRRLVRKALWITPQDPANKSSRLEMIRPTLLGLALSDDDLTWVAVRLALDSVPTIESDLNKVPTTEIAWLENLLPADRIDYAKGAFGHAFNPAQALIFLNAEFDKQPNDDLIAGYVESEDMRVHRDWSYALGAGRHGETAFRLATRVQDPQRRAALLAQAWKDLYKDSAQAARQILAIPELNPNDRAALEAQAASFPKKNP